MDSAINLTVTPLQAFLALAFQVWLIIFPVILIRKVSRLEALIEEHFSSPQEAEQESGNV